jgi:hypothetical protein
MFVILIHPYIKQEKYIKQDKHDFMHYMDFSK